MSAPPLIVYTDMDGTLLDHHSYDYRPAQPALARLAALTIPVVLNTSKTYSELEDWRRQLGLVMPVIVENGAAAYVPRALLTETDLHQFKADQPGIRCSEGGGELVLEMAPGLAEIHGIIHPLREQQGFRFQGFSDFSVQQLCDLTGLAPRDAENALKRGFSEPICWQDSESRWQQFVDAIAAQGLQALRGGRFSHIMGPANKGRAMELVTKLLYPDHRPATVALGDSGNDLAMLEVADYPVVIRSPSHPLLQVERCRGVLRVSQDVGPAGWNSCVNEILDELGL